MRAVVWEGLGTVVVRDVERARTMEDDVLIEVAWCGVCGSDLHIVAGEHARARPGITLGHEVVGVVAVDGNGFSAGDPVFINPMISCGHCDACVRGLIQACANMRAVGVDIPGGLAEQLSVPKLSLRRLPNALDLERAALIEPLAVAVRAVRRSGLRLGDRVHIIGGGPIGRLVATCAREAGAGRLTMSEASRRRRDRAEAAMIEMIDEPDDPGAQVVFDATGHPSVSPTLANWARVGGQVVVVAAYPPDPVGVGLQMIMFKELTIVGSRVYTSEDIDAAVDLLTDDRIDLSGIVTSTVSLDEAPDAISRLRNGEEVKVLVNPRG